MNRAERIREAIESALEPDRLDIEDESHRHAGHAGARPGGETHYNVTVVSSGFAEMSRIDRQRRVYALLEAEFEGGLHALTVRALTPAEDV
jgi:BolA protein